MRKDGQSLATAQVGKWLADEGTACLRITPLRRSYVKPQIQCDVSALITLLVEGMLNQPRSRRQVRG